MIKVNEKIDLSNKVLEIDIESPIFTIMLHDLNMEIKRAVGKIFERDFEGGEITLKIKVEIPDAYKEYPKTDRYGNSTTETYRYRKPRFEHAVTTTLKKQYKQEGIYAEDRDIKFVDGQYLACPIQDPQISVFDRYEIDEEEIQND